ncbi:MAG: GreA/GreB family elongation factor [Candidatus Dojkabacteria bacterium]|nr:GreA/GreB family elongation factor [Candidatus Dojkabacteria bacterium]
MKSILLSKEKLKELKKQYRELSFSLSRQKEEQIKKGGSSDSWHESAAFGATQAALEAKVRELKNILSEAKELPELVDNDKLMLGSRFRICSEEKEIIGRLVHPLEADPANNLVSIESPLGQAIKGKKVDDHLEFNGKKYRVLKIS